jgi:hypothetical protein
MPPTRTGAPPTQRIPSATIPPDARRRNRIARSRRRLSTPVLSLTHARAEERATPFRGGSRPRPARGDKKWPAAQAGADCQRFLNVNPCYWAGARSPEGPGLLACSSSTWGSWSHRETDVTFVIGHRSLSIASFHVWPATPLRTTGCLRCVSRSRCGPASAPRRGFRCLVRGTEPFRRPRPGSRRGIARTGARPAGRPVAAAARGESFETRHDPRR